MRLLVLILFIGGLSAGCSKQIEKFVDVKKPPTNPDNSTSSPIGMKISGGGQSAEGSDVDVKYSIGYKDREMTGSQFKARVTISGHRPTF